MPHDLSLYSNKVTGLFCLLFGHQSLVLWINFPDKFNWERTSIFRCWGKTPIRCGRRVAGIHVPSGICDSTSYSSPFYPKAALLACWMPDKGSWVNNQLGQQLIVSTRTNITAKHQLCCKDQKHFSTQKLTFLSTLKSSHIVWVVSTWPEEFGCRSWRLEAWQHYVTGLGLLQLQVPVCFMLMSLDPQLRHIKSTHTLGNGFSWWVVTWQLGFFLNFVHGINNRNKIGFVQIFKYLGRPLILCI